MAAEASELTDVGVVDDFSQGACTIVHVGSREIGIVRWNDDRFFALRNRCPHQGGPICAGSVGPKVITREGGPVSELDLALDEPVITCGWHHWEFSIATGRSLWDERLRLRTYPVTVRNGRVLVEL